MIKPVGLTLSSFCVLAYISYLFDFNNQVTCLWAITRDICQCHTINEKLSLENITSFAFKS